MSTILVDLTGPASPSQSPIPYTEPHCSATLTPSCCCVIVHSPSQEWYLFPGAARSAIFSETIPLPEQLPEKPPILKTLYSSKQSRRIWRNLLCAEHHRFRRPAPIDASTGVVRARRFWDLHRVIVVRLAPCRRCSAAYAILAPSRSAFKTLREKRHPSRRYVRLPRCRGRHLCSSFFPINPILLVRSGPGLRAFSSPLAASR